MEWFIDMNRFKLTTPQTNIWNLQKYYENSAIGNLSGTIFFRDSRDVELIQKALNKMIELNSSLRLRFDEDANGPYQYVVDYCWKEIPIIHFENDKIYEEYAKEKATQPLGLINKSLCEFEIVVIGSRVGIYARLSHLIADAWTFSFMAQLVDDAYQKIIDGNSDYYSSDYLNFVQGEKEYFESNKYIKDVEYWNGKYVSLPEKSSIKMPTREMGIAASRHVFRFSEALTAEIKDQQKKYGITAPVVFQTALLLYLKKIAYEDTSEITIGIPVLNRSNLKEKKCTGMFISTLPLTINVSDEASFVELAKTVQLENMQVYRHQKYPYDHILKNLRDKHNFTGNLYDVMISFQNAESKIEADSIWYSNGSSEVPFVYHIDDRDGQNQYTISIDYQTDLFNDEEIVYIESRIEHILEQIISDANIKIKDISIIGNFEKNVLNSFNDTFVDGYQAQTIDALFEKMVAAHEDDLAIVSCDLKLTYKVLDIYSDIVAMELIKYGVGPRQIVPIISNRSGYAIVAMLGIIKAGAAYMPVDPKLPIERIEVMISQCGSKIILVNNCDLQLENTCVDIQQINYDISDIRDISDPLYVLFTSGSTGVPKGAIITHKNLYNFVNSDSAKDSTQAECIKYGRVTLCDASFSFDISVYEIFASLLNGQTVVLTSDDLTSDEKAQLMLDNGVDVLHCTPTKFKLLLDSAIFKKALRNLKYIMLGAESFPTEVIDEINQYTSAAIFNGYGPTETTIGVCFQKVIDRFIGLHKVFENSAASHSSEIAVISQDRSFTYSEINRMADSLANKLTKLRISKGDVVGAYLDRTELVIVAQIAALKLGGVFLPIDHRYPQDRIDYMLADCNVSIVLTDEELPPSWNVNSFNIRKFNFEECDYYSVDVEPDDPCYIIYTSGSTGKPKGCVLKHRELVNFCVNNNILESAKDIDKKIAVAVNTISFDFFIAESLMPLVHGWTVVIASDEESNEKARFRELIIKHKVNIVQTTPTRLELYTSGNDNSHFQQIQLVVSAGEALPAVLLQKIRSICGAKVYNPLGPSECSVWNLGGNFKKDITIGKPIANNQVYIVDSTFNMLPIGVAGELCIAGEGVGAGYLNKPELTAEKFIHNPFATEENHHGKVMYRTGDLARWRVDGEIDFLGRIDTQVKIRGLRIELGEIESVMASFPGITMSVATDKRDDNGRQYLVGYFTSTEAIDDKELRQHLSTKLPRYMLPNYYMRLDKVPMTASGKIDRKNLPIPEFTVEKTEYVAPVTEEQSILCDILAGVFDVDTVGINDDFFDMGGDSLGAISYVSMAHSKGIEFSLQNIFDYPTVAQLSEFITNGTRIKLNYRKEDFDKFNELLSVNHIDESFVPEERSLGNVLITGSTGFLGAHVVDEYLKSEDGIAYCLVRGNEKRLVDILKYYFDDKYMDLMGSKIIPIVGDITDENLCKILPENIQTIIHTAASVKHYGSYKYFEDINVNGTKNVIKCAQQLGAKMMHVSTLSISGNSLAEEFAVYRNSEHIEFREDDLFVNQPLENVYIHSKFEAEVAVFEAMLEGLDAKIIRVGNLTNRFSDLRFQPNYESNAFLTRMKALLDVRKFPDYLLPLYAEFSPIDFTARGIILLAKNSRRYTVFHLNNNKDLPFEQMIEMLNNIGVNVDVVDAVEFSSILEAMLNNPDTKYIYEAFQNDMDDDGTLVYDSNIHINHDFTVWLLNKLGFEWPEIGQEYIKNYIEYFKKIGYLGDK